MKRRDFINKSVKAGLLTGAAVSFGKYGQLLANTAFNNEVPYDLVAIRNGEPAAMYQRALNAMGGISQYVKKGQRVVVKPNIGWDVVPELGANTNPELVKAIVKSCLDAGASSVYTFDHTCDDWKKCYKNSKLEDVIEDAGGKVVPGNNERYYEEIEIPKGKRLTSAKVHEQILEADVFINVPVLKNHGSAKLTISMKNLMGIVWDRGYWHRNDLHQCIADFATWRQPDLNIVDAYRVMMKNGPRGRSEADVAKMKFLVMSDDMVAADAAAAKIFGMDPNGVPHIEYAHDFNVGNMNLKQQEIGRIKM
ncbi:MAG: DUF362 domain-containing protein [Bacteroidales bacterium]|nr:DUF362 domain-containing protein [Bacteroidales bacterium]MCF8339161.1 DUF362 domain-containing protein [Bacteroidales bacterium]